MNKTTNEQVPPTMEKNSDRDTSTPMETAPDAPVPSDSKRDRVDDAKSSGKKRGAAVGGKEKRLKESENPPPQQAPAKKKHQRHVPQEEKEEDDEMEASEEDASSSSEGAEDQTEDEESSEEEQDRQVRKHKDKKGKTEHKVQYANHDKHLQRPRGVPPVNQQRVAFPPRSLKFV
jgi:hypothetical protein